MGVYTDLDETVVLFKMVAFTPFLYSGTSQGPPAPLKAGLAGVKMMRALPLLLAVPGRNLCQSKLTVDTAALDRTLADENERLWKPYIYICIYMYEQYTLCAT